MGYTSVVVTLPAPATSAALVRLGDRPSVVLHDGWRVYICVHDAAHRWMRGLWRQRLALVHPDSTPELTPFLVPDTDYHRRRYRRRGRPLTGYSFRRVQAQFRAWLADEIAWYATYGLTLPC